MDDRSYTQAFLKNFLGTSPDWYKITIITFLILNPILFFITPFWAGWLLVVEFIFTLGMALKCYPLQPGGLLAIEAIIIGMTKPEHIKAEVLANFEVILLLMFMVARVCQFCKKFFTDLGELGEETCDIFYGYAHRDCAG